MFYAVTVFSLSYIIPFNIFTASTLAILIIWIAIAIYNYNKIKLKNSKFLAGFSFILIISGKFIFMMTSAEIIGNILKCRAGIPLGLLIITLLTYNFYKNSIERFLSVFFTIMLTFIYVYSEKPDIIIFDKNLIFNGLILLQFTTINLLVFNYDKLNSNYLPILYAFIFSNYIIIFLGIINRPPILDITNLTWNLNMLIINKFIICELILLLGFNLNKIDKFKYEIFIISFIGIIMLQIINLPGIAISISIIMLGYIIKEIIIIKLGTILIQCFLIFYLLDYYIIKYLWFIIASGLILLFLRNYGFSRGWLKKDLVNNKFIDNN